MQRSEQHTVIITTQRNYKSQHFIPILVKINEIDLKRQNYGVFINICGNIIITVATAVAAYEGHLASLFRSSQFSGPLSAFPQKNTYPVPMAKFLQAFSSLSQINLDPNGLQIR